MPSVVCVHLPSKIPIVGCKLMSYVLLRYPDKSVSTDGVPEMLLRDPPRSQGSGSSKGVDILFLSENNDVSTPQPNDKDEENFMPLLSLVLFIATFMGFFGYNL
ncbi:hypothetical protein VNO78_19491 [Psophocarpus tetragonolobus]|uniref:Uncharacterized protein n=1 Tax=Psophocarpus tetragonolobus TaxID=3891 RepID=A0AAN9S9J8_PSOTE